jgi:hypothetical protein
MSFGISQGTVISESDVSWLTAHDAEVVTTMLQKGDV